MKTLKQIIAEAKDKRPYPTTKHGDALHHDHFKDEDESEAIRNAGPHPSTEKMMKNALAGAKYKRFIPKGTKMDNPDKPVTKLYQVKERKKSK